MPDRGKTCMLLPILSLLVLLRATSEARMHASEFRVNGVASSLSIIPAFAMPGKAVPVEASGNKNFVTADGSVEAVVRKEGVQSWNWHPPRNPGMYRAHLIDGASGKETALHLFVLMPAERIRDGKLNGYRIGAYPKKGPVGSAVYRVPEGYIEVTPSLSETKLSPHFTVGQFLCKQAGGWPKYLHMNPKLILRLEESLELVRSYGIKASTFQVMSGYRTPDYNKGLGNVTFSAHLYGAAADIFIDEDGNGVMDDLNGDGRENLLDASLLYRILEAGLSEENGKGFRGGLGNYDSNHAHGPFVHLDVRGKKARWGRVLDAVAPVKSEASWGALPTGLP